MIDRIQFLVQQVISYQLQTSATEMPILNGSKDRSGETERTIDTVKLVLDEVRRGDDGGGRRREENGQVDDNG